MNLNLLSNSLLFLSPHVIRNINESQLSSNTSTKFNSNSNKNVYIPSYICNRPIESCDSINKFVINDEYNSDLLTYTGSPLGFDNILNHPTNEDIIKKLYDSSILINTLYNVFTDQGFHKLNQYQSSLFDELSNGRDVILHSYTSSGKTFSVLLYMVLRYYYNLDSKCLNSKSLSDFIDHIEKTHKSASQQYKFNQRNANKRVLVLCPTKELAVQSYRQIVNFANKNEDIAHLIIDDNVNSDPISSHSIFIVGSSNQVESYFLNSDPKITRSMLQTVEYVFLDEMDRLIRVPNQYATQRKKDKLFKNPGSAYNICQSLLTISPNKVRFVCASASVTRHHIRKFNSLLQLYRKGMNNVTAVIRKKASATETGRYVTVPDTIKLFYSTCKSDTLDSMVDNLSKILKNKNEKSFIFLSSGSLLKLQDQLKSKGIESKIFHHQLGINDNLSEDKLNIQKIEWLRGSDTNNNNTTIFTNLFENDNDNCVIIASTDSARGIHIPMMDSVYILGRPRNVNEYIHISGRVGRCMRNGRCVTIDTKENIKILLSWQKQINTNILQLFDENNSSALNIDDNDNTKSI